MPPFLLYRYSPELNPIGRSFYRIIYTVLCCLLLYDYFLTLNYPTPSCVTPPLELTWSTVKVWMRNYPRGREAETMTALTECLARVDHSLIFNEYRHRHYV